MAIVRQKRILGSDVYKLIPPKKTPEELREYAKQNSVPTDPLDVARLASALGITVLYEPMGSDLSGYLEKRNAGWVLGVNSLQHRKRQRFTIAHELAHYLLHGNQQSEFRDVVLMQRAAHRNQMESDADAFAGELLMPSQEFNDKIQGGIIRLSDLSDHFDVSIMAAKYKATLLGYRIRSE